MKANYRSLISMVTEMARLTAARRASLPTSAYGVPSKAPGPGSYPMPDRKHAAVAKAYASRFASPSEKKAIDAKANRILHAGSETHRGIPGGREKLGSHHADHGFIRHSKQGY